MSELTVPTIDFSTLGELGNIYRKANADQARQQTLSSLGQGVGPDSNALLRSGDLSLAQLGVAMRNRQEDNTRQAQQDARQAQQDVLTNQHWKDDFGLRKAAGIRADEGPVEQSAQRAIVAEKYGLKPGTPEHTAFVVSGKLPESVGNNGIPEVGLNPAYGVGADGKVGAIQFSKTGKAVQTQLPEGFSLQKEPLRVDAGTHVNLIDPITRQIVGTLPKDIAGAEQQKTLGDEAAKAQVALPQTLATSQQILKTIDDVKNHPGKKWSLGAYSKLPTIPDTSQANFRAAAAQLTGQTFLQAYQTLRGGGAITDIEGAKGTAALARLDQAQTEAEYDKALNDFRDVVKGGMLRASAKARGGIGQAPATSVVNDPSQGNLTADPLGIR